MEHANAADSGAWSACGGQLAAPTSPETLHNGPMHARLDKYEMKLAHQHDACTKLKSDLDTLHGELQAGINDDDWRINGTCAIILGKVNVRG